MMAKKFYKRRQPSAESVARQMNRHPDDPTPEEIWGTPTTMGLAEMIRLERPPKQDDDCKVVHLEMMTYGFGKMIGND